MLLDTLFPPRFLRLHVRDTYVLICHHLDRYEQIELVVFLQSFYYTSAFVIKPFVQQVISDLWY